MRDGRIDFISSYCDRWCERCTFTSRCSAYAVEIATAMCDGDFEAGLELAVGAPRLENEAEAQRRAEFLASLHNVEPTEQEMAQYEREHEARDERIAESPVTTSATKVRTLATGWLHANRERLLASADAALKDALEIAGWDAYLISAKVHRALDGRDEYMRGEDFDDDLVQNDWNGSAKVAQISITGSIAAWTIIAAATADPDGQAVTEELQVLRTQLEAAFPYAWNFVRPGFDDPSA